MPAFRIVPLGRRDFGIELKVAAQHPEAGKGGGGRGTGVGTWGSFGWDDLSMEASWRLRGAVCNLGIIGSSFGIFGFSGFQRCLFEGIEFRDGNHNDI